MYLMALRHPLKSHFFVSPSHLASELRALCEVLDDDHAKSLPRSSPQRYPLATQTLDYQSTDIIFLLT